MASQPYLIARLVPDTPVDGASFATYLDSLQFSAFGAYTGAPVSDLAYSSPLTLRMSLFGSLGNERIFSSSVK
jgi:hypothetical protein